MPSTRRCSHGSAATTGQQGCGPNLHLPGRGQGLQHQGRGQLQGGTQRQGILYQRSCMHVSIPLHETLKSKRKNLLNNNDNEINEKEIAARPTATTFDGKAPMAPTSAMAAMVARPTPANIAPCPTERAPPASNWQPTCNQQLATTKLASWQLAANSK